MVSREGEDMSPRKHTMEELKEHMSRTANKTRDTADEMAGMYGGCDDPLYPLKINEFRDWVDFAENVCRPLVEAGKDKVTEQAAMARYRKASPFFISVALVMALNRIESLEKRFKSHE